MAERMARIANVSLNELGKLLFDSSFDGKSAEDLLHSDFKEFHIAEQNLGVGPVSYTHLKYGSRNLLMTILVTALVTGLVQFIFFPGTALLGASGVVFMMIVLNSFTEMRRGGIPLTMLLVVALYLGNEVVAGLSESDNISQMTHIVGGLCGVVFGFSLARAKKR